MSGVKTYNFAHCIVLIDGLPFEGGADGDVISVEPSSEVWTSESGTDGEVTRSASNDRRAAINFTFKETSDLNPFFRAKVTAAQTAGNGDIFSLFIKDLNTGEQVIAPQVWVETPAPVTKGKEASDREWGCMGANVAITN